MKSLEHSFYSHMLTAPQLVKFLGTAKRWDKPWADLSVSQGEPPLSSCRAAYSVLLLVSV